MLSSVIFSLPKNAFQYVKFTKKLRHLIKQRSKSFTHELNYYWNRPFYFESSRNEHSSEPLRRERGVFSVFTLYVPMFIYLFICGVVNGHCLQWLISKVETWHRCWFSKNLKSAFLIFLKFCVLAKLCSFLCVFVCFSIYYLVISNIIVLKPVGLGIWNFT